jgi:hypothetical protein
MKHIPIKQVWLKEIIILIKDVQKWVDQKMLTNVMNFFIFIVYWRFNKVEKCVVHKMKRLKNLNMLYKMETLNMWKSFKVYHTWWKKAYSLLQPFLPYVLIPIKNKK